MQKKIKVSFYLKNSNYFDIDLSKPNLGNPGIGGREYFNLSLSYMLNLSLSNIFDIVVLAQTKKNLPSSLNVIEVVDVFDAIKVSNKEICDIFVSDVSLSENYIKKLITNINKFKIKTVLRMGLLPSSKILNYLASCKFINAIVCNEREMAENLIGHQIQNKSKVIVNAIHYESYNNIETKKFNDYQDTIKIAFLGAITPVKNFHLLAEIWPKIVKKYKNAELWVFGSAKTYDSKAKLGKYNITYPNYEKKFINYLTNKKGIILDSVKFFGSVGIEKYSSFHHVDIGVVNPSGNSETFCLSAVELQAAGIPVIAGARGGLMDTVLEGQTGFLVNSSKELLSRINYLIENRLIRKKMGIAAHHYVKNKYNFSLIMFEWEELLKKINDNMEIGDIIPKSYGQIYLNFFRYIYSRQIKLFLTIIPSYLSVLDFLMKINSFRRKIFRK